MAERQVLLVGAFPPPVHGASTVTAAVREELAAYGARFEAIDLSTGSLRKSLAARFAKALNVGRSLIRLLFAEPRPTTAYFAVSGGLGQIYDLMLVIVARLRRFRVIMHHNSFRYIRRTQLVTTLLVKVGGRDAHHVVLSDGMAHGLRDGYGPHAVHVVSNAAFLPERIAHAPRSTLRTVGFLSNISADKGILRYFDVMTEVMSRDPTIGGLVAGQFMDEAMRSRVLDAVRGQPRLEYVGPRYGADKDRFYEGVDMLLFPSTYVHEAEPLTVHEALRHGLPVVCLDRGCLSEVVEDSFGLVVATSDRFVSIAAERILFWSRNPPAFRQASAAALHRARAFAANGAAARERLRVLLTEL